MSYKEVLVGHCWAYQQRFFPAGQTYFERPFAPDGRPPVFLAGQADHNVITRPVNDNK